ncbi:GbsR/MarR family transcriptional regulator [Streptosporangium sp. NBC_01756]|uniref:GbsR/MarR family transcriptional regulator n=1 Tax=Streptosporangium sp. NBC_01756 TaxID=2975950 RepID=UPI002DDA4B31|nr:helix-turn-helix domain-containing protein [Streptosporangium sp. NBC_01756]WSC86580.1 helix-turn-helix domain-containing protein [Streptosporangium sp. NBC_01756]
MPGDRLTQQDRRQIADGLAGGLTYAEIARRLKRPTSTVTREVMRHGGPGAYHADQAQRAADRRVHHKTTTPAAARGDADVGGRDLRTVREVADQLTDLLVQGGIPQMMAKMLAALYTTDSGSLTSAELVQHLQVSPASISKAVGYLEAQELIRRERDPRRRAERYVIDDNVWYQAMVASARANALLADTARRSARTLGPTTPAGVRLENMSHFLTHVGEDLVRSAEHWRQVYAAPRRTNTGEPGVDHPHPLGPTEV